MAIEVRKSYGSKSGRHLRLMARSDIDSYIGFETTCSIADPLSPQSGSLQRRTTKGNLCSMSMGSPSRGSHSSWIEDAGYTWQSGTVGAEAVVFSAPSCADASHCVAIVQTTPKPDPSVPGTLVALSSVDGGQSWQSHDLPANISTDALGTSPSCPYDSQCLAPILLHQDQGSPQPVIAATTDGGDSWQEVPIDDSCIPSGCITNIQTLQCPDPSICLALGDLRNFHLPPVLLTNRPAS